MTTLTIEFPKALTAELDAAVEAGWFENPAEAVLAAVRSFVSQRRYIWLADELAPGMNAAESDFVELNAASVIAEAKARKEAEASTP